MRQIILSLILACAGLGLSQQASAQERTNRIFAATTANTDSGRIKLAQTMQQLKQRGSADDTGLKVAVLTEVAFNRLPQENFSAVPSAQLAAAKKELNQVIAWKNGLAVTTRPDGDYIQWEDFVTVGRSGQPGLSGLTTGEVQRALAKVQPARPKPATAPQSSAVHASHSGYVTRAEYDALAQRVYGIEAWNQHFKAKTTAQSSRLTAVEGRLHTAEGAIRQNQMGVLQINNLLGDAGIPPYLLGQPVTVTAPQPSQPQPPPQQGSGSYPVSPPS